MLHLKDQWVLKKLIIERSHGRSKTLSSQRMKGAMWQNPLFEFLRLSWFLFNPTPKSCGEAAGRSPFDEAHDQAHPESGMNNVKCKEVFTSPCGLMPFACDSGHRCLSFASATYSEF